MGPRYEIFRDPILGSYLNFEVYNQGGALAGPADIPVLIVSVVGLGPPWASGAAKQTITFDAGVKLTVHKLDDDEEESPDGGGGATKQTAS